MSAMNATVRRLYDGVALSYGMTMVVLGSTIPSGVVFDISAGLRAGVQLNCRLLFFLCRRCGYCLIVWPRL